MRMWDVLIGWICRRGERPLGARGEALAARFVKRELGWRVLARNVRAPGGELDIVALAGEMLVFIEVRTRASEAFGPPERTITGQKRRRVIRSARWFIRTRRLGRFTPRCDTISIVWPHDGPPLVRHQANAFALNAW